jgi:hypothetical protein
MKEFFSKGWKPLLFKPGANEDVPQLETTIRTYVRAYLNW